MGVAPFVAIGTKGGRQLGGRKVGHRVLVEQSAVPSETGSRGGTDSLAPESLGGIM